MENETTVDAEYQNGFNQGYLIAEHASAASKELFQNLKPASPRSQGLQAGMNQYLTEQTKQKTPTWLRHDRLNFKENSKEARDLEKE